MIFVVINISLKNLSEKSNKSYKNIFKVPPEIPMKKPTTITLKFVNPLKKVLTNCKFNVSGPTLLRNQVVPYPDAKPGALIKVDVEIVPKTDGEQKLVATFTSKQLIDITGSAKFEVIGDE